MKISWARTCPVNLAVLAVRLLLTLLLSTTWTACLVFAPHEFTSQRAHFTIDVPGIMTSSKRPYVIKGFGTSNVLRFGSKWANVYYSVLYGRLPAALKLDTHVLSSSDIMWLTMKYARDDAEDANATIISSRGIRLPNLFGVETTIRVDERRGSRPNSVVVTSWVRYFLVGHDVYEIAASTVTNDPTPSKATEDFLNSFRVLGLTQ